MSTKPEALNDVKGSIRNAEEILGATQKKIRRAKTEDERRYYRGKKAGMLEVLGGLKLALWHIENLGED